MSAQAQNTQKHLIARHKSVTLLRWMSQVTHESLCRHSLISRRNTQLPRQGMNESRWTYDKVVHIYIYTYTYVYIYIYMYIYIYIHIYIFIYIYMCIYTDICVYTCIYVIYNIYIYICVYIYINTYIYEYVYTYYVYTYIYIYIYVYMWHLSQHCNTLIHCKILPGWVGWFACFDVC